jgi:hypothetical protein
MRRLFAGFAITITIRHYWRTLFATPLAETLSLLGFLGKVLFSNNSDCG